MRTFFNTSQLRGIQQQPGRRASDLLHLIKIGDVLMIPQYLAPETMKAKASRHHLSAEAEIRIRYPRRGDPRGRKQLSPRSQVVEFRIVVAWIVEQKGVSWTRDENEL
jgi:hypothetical protein